MRQSYTDFMDLELKKLTKKINALRKVHESENSRHIDLKSKTIATIILEVEQAIFFAGAIKKYYKTCNLTGIENYQEGTFDCIKTIKDLVYLTHSPMLAHTQHVPKEIIYLESLFRFIYADKWSFNDAIVEKFRIYLEDLPEIVGHDFLHIRKNTSDIVDDKILDSELFTKKSKIRVEKYLSSPASVGADFKNKKNLNLYEPRLHIYSKVLEQGLNHKDNNINFPTKEILSELKTDKGYYSVAKIENDNDIFSFRDTYSSEVINKYKELSEYNGDLNINSNLNVKRTLNDISIDMKDFFLFAEEVLDKKQPKANWSSRLKRMHFLCVRDKFKISDVIHISGLAHWVGLPNVGKSTVMKALSAYLCHKELTNGPIVLVMKDNNEVNSTVRELKELGDFNVIPLLGSDIHKHITKELESSSNPEESIFDSVKNNEIFDLYSNACKLNALIDNPEGAKSDDIGYICNHIKLFNVNYAIKNKAFKNSSDFDKDDYDCDDYDYDDYDEENNYRASNNFLPGHKPLRKKTFPCPYHFECEKYKTRAQVKNADIIVTNIHSFIQSSLNKVLFDKSSLYGEYLLKNADIIMIDEADLAKSIATQAFAIEESLIDAQNKSTFEIMVETIEEYARGQKVSNPTMSRWLTDARTTKSLGEYMLERVVNDSFLTKKELKSSLTPNTQFNSFTKRLLKRKGILSNVCTNSDNAKNIVNSDDNKIISGLKKSMLEDFNSRFHQLLNNYEDNKINLQEIKESDDYKEDMKELFISYIQLITAAKEKKNKNYELYLDIVWDKFIAFYNLNDKNIKPEAAKRLKSRLGASIISLSFIVLYTKVIITGEVLMVKVGKKDANSAARTSYLKQYKGLLPIAPNHSKTGIKYIVNNSGPYAKHGLSLINYFYVGSYFIENMDKIYSYLDKTTTAHVILLSATSYMPGSPKYHIDVLPQYLIANSNRPDGSEDVPTINYKVMQLLDSEGIPLKLSGLDERLKSTTIEQMAESLCRIDQITGACKLDTLMSFTKPNRRRIALAVGSFEEARLLYRYLNEQIKNNYSLNEKYKACIIETDLEEHAEDTSEDKQTGIFLKNKLHLFDKTDYNIAIMVVKSVERGINILTTDDNGNKVAAFSVAMYLKRPYPVPNDINDLVSLINMVSMEKYKRKLNSEEVDEFTISKEVNNLMNVATRAEEAFYSRDYYAFLSDYLRRGIIADLMTLTHQFEGRFTRGNVDATIVFGCGSFFPNYNYNDEDKNDTVKTSIIKGFEQYLDSFENVINPTEEDEINKVIMNKLYGYRLKALKNIEFI